MAQAGGFMLIFWVIPALVSDSHSQYCKWPLAPTLLTAHSPTVLEGTLINSLDYKLGFWDNLNCCWWLGFLSGVSLLTFPQEQCYPTSLALFLIDKMNRVGTTLATSAMQQIHISILFPFSIAITLMSAKISHSIWQCYLVNIFPRMSKNAANVNVN